MVGTARRQRRDEGSAMLHASTLANYYDSHEESISKKFKSQVLVAVKMFRMDGQQKIRQNVKTVKPEKRF